MSFFRKLLFSLFVIAFVGCKSNGYYYDATILEFANNLNDTSEARMVCVLDESVDPLAAVSDFSMINDTTFVVVDKRSVAIFNTQGRRINRPFLRGRGKGEIISPSSVCVSSKYIYVWCSSLMKILALTHEGEFHAEYTGFDRAVKKMTVDDDKHLYMYTSGESDNAGNAFDDVVRVFDLAQKKTVTSFGKRTGEDEVMFIAANSAGIDFDNGFLLYAHPGNPRVFVRNLHTNEESVYQIQDEEFNMQKVDHSKDITTNIREWVAFSQHNAVIRGVYSSEGKTYLVSEVGSYDMESRTVGTRKIKVYEMGSYDTPLKSIVFDNFYVVSGFDVRMNSLLFLYVITEKETDAKTVQNIYLKAFPLD